MAIEITEQLDTNACLMDWSPFSRDTYTRAANHTRRVGHYFGMMIEFLNNTGFPLDNITLIGHSMGAQICGFAGDYLKSRGLYANKIFGNFSFYLLFYILKFKKLKHLSLL